MFDERVKTAREADAIKEGLISLSRRARRGAKVYISRSMSLEMTFEKDGNRRYVFPIYNNAGISSIATIPVEVDESLNDSDFIIGNAKNYILNMTKPTEIYAELHGKRRVIKYTVRARLRLKSFITTRRQRTAARTAQHKKPPTKSTREK